MATHSDSKRVLITGLNGFTGRHLAGELRLIGFDVVGVAAQLAKCESGFQCDLRDTSKLADIVAEVRPEYVVHLAALSHVVHADQDMFYSVNVRGTESLLKALTIAECIPKKVILASSANVYGNDQQSPIVEEATPRPVNHYAISKLAMEYMARNWFDRLPILLTRPFNYTGPGQAPNFLVPKIVSHYQRRMARVSLGNVNVQRDFSDVGFVIEAYIRLLASPVVGEVVNICSGRVCSLKDILKVTGELAGYQIGVDVNPDLVRASEILSLCGSNKKLFEMVGEIAVPDMRYTLERMLNMPMS